MNPESNYADQIINLTTDAARHTVAEYAHWYFVSSIAWICCGFVCAYFANWFWRKKENLDGWDEIMPWVAIVTLTLMSVLFVFTNIPTLVQPEAYAIHQLLKDVHGKGE